MAANVIAGIACVISAIAVIVSAMYNHKTQKQYIESLSPLLSFSLVKQNYLLYMSVMNTGKSAATDIKIDFKKIENNGDKNEFLICENLKDKITLYPNEQIAGRIAISGENICTEIAPVVWVSVSYVKGNTGQTEQYDREICFTDSRSSGDDKKEQQLADISKRLDEISRSQNRTANYLEGRWLAKFDELNAAPHGSLYQDMRDAVNNVERSSDKCTGRDKNSTMQMSSDILR